MNKTANTWRLVPVAAAQHELHEVRAALGFLPQGYAAMAGLGRLADLLAASEPSPTSSAVSTEHDEPITVTVDHDPRGVSVGVWQGSHCIYSGAHPLPSAPGVSKVENNPAAYLALDEEGLPCMLFFDVAEARTYCALGGEPEALWRRPAPAARDALDAARYRSFRKALTRMDTTWLDRVGAALEALGIDPDDDVLPTAEQVDAAFDAALAAALAAVSATQAEQGEQDA